jgi:hypothetical protein
MIAVCNDDQNCVSEQLRSCALVSAVVWDLSLSAWYLFSWIVGLSHIQPGDAITPPCSLDGHSH